MLHLPAIADEDISGTCDGDNVTIEDDAIIIAIASNRDTYYSWTTLTVLRDGDEIELGYPSLELPVMTPCCKLCLAVNSGYVRADMETMAPFFFPLDGIDYPAGTPVCGACESIASGIADVQEQRRREERDS